MANTLSFDEQFYLTQNPDVAAAVSRGIFTSGADHYNQFGRFEARNPNAYFDTAFYLGQYPDVSQAGVNPLEHFLNNGAAEGRFANETERNTIDLNGNGGADDFDNAAYLDAYPDVADAVAAGTFTSGYQHFVQFGQFEARVGTLSNGTKISGPFTNTGTVPGTGSSLTLTTDIVATQGTSGADTISGVIQATTAASTFQVGDTINGGAGADRLNLTVTDATLTGAILADVSNVESIYVRNAGTAFTLNATTIQGATEFWNDRSTAALTIDNINALATIGLNQANGTTNIQFTDSVVSGTNDTLNVVANASGTASNAAILNVGNQTSQTAAVIENLNVTSQGSAASNLDISGLGAGVKTITVAGSQAVTLGAVDVTALNTVDASKMTAGGLTVDLSAGARDITFTGSGFNDSVVLGGRYTTADKLDGGAGTDNLTINVAQANPTSDQTNVTNFEKLTISNASTGTINTARFGVTTALEFTTDGTAPTTVEGLVSGATITLGKAVDALNLTVNLSDAAGAGDSLTVVYNDAADDANDGAITLNAAGVETLTFDASKEAATTATGQAINITDAQLDTLIVKAGANTLDFSGAELGTVLTKFDASGTTGAGGVNVLLNDQAVQGAEVIGTKNADVFVGSNQADTITGGEGADTITGGAGIDTINLGETTKVTDTVSLNEIVSSANRDVINGFTAGATNGDLIQIGADETTATTANTAAPAFSVIGAQSNATTLTSVDIVEFAFDAGDRADLGASTNGSELLKAIAIDGSATLTAAADGQDVYLIAYDNGNAYLYHANELGNNGTGDNLTFEAGEIQLVATITGVAVGSLTVDNFGLVA